LAESLGILTRSLFAELGRNPGRSIPIIVSRASELLRCESAAHGCIDAATGELRFREALNLPARPSAVREFARRICREIITREAVEPVCDLGPDEGPVRMFKAHGFAKPGFKSFLGHPVTIEGHKSGALVALSSKSRRFSELDQGVITLLAGIIGVEDNRSQREEALSRRVCLEKMLKDLSTRAINIKDDLEFTQHCLEMLATRMGVGGSFLWEFDPKRKTLSNTCEWLSEGHPPQEQGLHYIPMDSLPWAASRLMKGEVLKITDTSTIPSKRERELLEQIGVRACLIIPLFINEGFYGLIGLSCYTAPKHWISEDIVVLQTAAEIMMRCIENRHLTDELIANQRNLEKDVAKQTSALREANKRLSEEIAARKKTISRLKQKEAELSERNKTLMELSTAFATLFNRRKSGSAAVEECVIEKIDRLIDPAAANSVPNGLGTAQAKYIGDVRERLKELSSLLKTKTTYVYQCLSPMEITVANLIRQGKGTKDIADLLKLSRRTVEVHRYSIRKKLQLEHTKMNLETYLSTMD
jgi:GAF domain-containing protein